jgi:predicted nucleotidyltransferase component of viral defense system
MIKPSEIQNKARAVLVRDQQIEKDYILSWILQGVAGHENLASALVFKGGTVLKKAYFKDYRFSEDLDFTLLNDEITNEQIFQWFEETFEYIREEANIPLEIIDNNEHENGGINFYISYIGPLGGQGNNKRVKLDISRSEKLAFAPVRQNMILNYTDQEEHKLLCYPLEEVLVEKLRSVMQRMQARDFYDIWYLLEMHEMKIEFLISEFKAKCESKGLNPLQFHEKLTQRLASYKGRWQKSMNDQIKDLPDFDKVEREVQRHMRKMDL